MKVILFGLMSSLLVSCGTDIPGITATFKNLKLPMNFKPDDSADDDQVLSEYQGKESAASSDAKAPASKSDDGFFLQGGGGSSGNTLGFDAKKRPADSDGKPGKSTGIFITEDVECEESNFGTPEGAEWYAALKVEDDVIYSGEVDDGCSKMAFDMNNVETEKDLKLTGAIYMTIDGSDYLFKTCEATVTVKDDGNEEAGEGDVSEPECNILRKNEVKVSGFGLEGELAP